MVSYSLLVFTIVVACAGGASAAEQQDSSDKSGLSRGAAAGILIGARFQLIVRVLLLLRESFDSPRLHPDARPPPPRASTKAQDNGQPREVHEEGQWTSACTAAE
ncbi:hypothetical protein EV714DRAFT_267593 [Schizophyllum commune]